MRVKLATVFTGVFCLQFAAVFADTTSELVKLPHGDRQMAFLLSDRIVLNQFVDAHGVIRHVNPGDNIVLKASSLFSDKKNNLYFFWDRVPPTGRGSIAKVTSKDQVGCFQLADFSGGKKGLNDAFETSWESVFYRLLELNQHTEINELIARVRTGELAENDFVMLWLKKDHQRLIQMHDLYEHVWLEWCKHSQFNSEKNRWHLTQRNFEEWYVGVQSQAPSQITQVRDFFRSLKVTPAANVN